jgi:hypothetical protein
LRDSKASPAAVAEWCSEGRKKSMSSLSLSSWLLPLKQLHRPRGGRSAAEDSSMKFSTMRSRPTDPTSASPCGGFSSFSGSVSFPSAPNFSEAETRTSSLRNLDTHGGAGCCCCGGGFPSMAAP